MTGLLRGAGLVCISIFACLPALAAQDKTSNRLLKEADALMAEARALYEEGKANDNAGGLLEAGFKADEARVKYQAVQQIAQGENAKRARTAVRDANSLIKLVNDARVALVPGAKPKPGAKSKPGAAPAPPPPPASEKKLPKGTVVDLLKRVAADKDVVAGKWIARPGKLIQFQRRERGAPWPRVQIPYMPPEEYDLLMTFRHTGNGEVVLLLSKGGRPFAFEMGTNGNTVFALSRVKTPPGDPGTMKIVRERCLEGAREYTAWIEVRNDGIKAYVNRLLIAYTALSSPQDLSLPPALALRSGRTLGVAAANQTVISSIKIVEVKGKGKPLR